MYCLTHYGTTKVVGNLSSRRCSQTPMRILLLSCRDDVLNSDGRLLIVLVQC